MFTGIIEAFGKVVTLDCDMENLHITIESSLSKELKIDQSLAHNCSTTTTHAYLHM